MKRDFMSAPEAVHGVRVVAQSVGAPLTRAAIFLSAKLSSAPRGRSFHSIQAPQRCPLAVISASSTRACVSGTGSCARLGMLSYRVLALRRERVSRAADLRGAGAALTVSVGPTLRCREHLVPEQQSPIFTAEKINRHARTRFAREDGLPAPAAADTIKLVEEGSVYSAIGDEGFERLAAAFYRQVPAE